MTVKIDFVHLGHVVGGDVRRSLVLNTRKFSEAAAYCKNVQSMTARAVQLDKGSKIFEVDTPAEVGPMIEAWAVDAYPVARVYYMEHALATAEHPEVLGHCPLDVAAMETLNAEGAENGDF